MPTVPTCGSTGCWHGARAAAQRRESLAGARAVAAHLVRELADVDRLLEVAGEARRDEPVAASLESAARSARRPGSMPFAPRLASLRAASVPSMSGSRRSIRITSGQMLACERDPLGAVRRLERPEPGGAQHVPGELQVLLVVVDDQDERAPRLSRLTGTASGDGDVIAVSSTRADPARARRGSLPRPRGRPASARDASPTSRSRPCAAISTRSSLRSTRSGRTSSSPTSACRRAAPTRGSRPPSGCARRIPTVGVVVLSQYANPSYALALLKGGSAGRAYLLKERVDDLGQLVAAIRAVAEGGSVIDPKVVEALVAENARGERVAAQRADAA